MLMGWPGSTVRDDATTWLERASHAIEKRNAALHATPVVRLGRPPATEQRLFLREMPRADRPYNERPLTARLSDAIRPEDAFSGWRDVAIAAGAKSRPQTSHSQTTDV